MKEIKLKIEYPEHEMVVLTNERGDTYTSRSEELMDFLHGIEPSEHHPEGTVVPYQTCPLCNGVGQTVADGWTSSTVYQICDVCNGQKIIPMHVLRDSYGK